MPFRHGVMDGDEMFILHIFDGDSMIFVHFFRFQGRQCDAAAADHSISQRMDGVAADRTDIEFASQHIGGDIFIDDVLSSHQFYD